MKVTMIKKFNIIISLWLIAIIALLVVLGLQLSNSGFFIGALVFAGLLAASNTINLVSGIKNYRIRIAESKKQFNR